MNESAEDVELIKEVVVTESPDPIKGGSVGELIILSLILYLVFLPVVVHECGAAVRAKPVIGIGPDVL